MGVRAAETMKTGGNVWAMSELLGLEGEPNSPSVCVEGGS
jgi:hypothetical protein